GSDELQLYFRLNKDLLTMNFEEFHKQIIPHEVSHYITRKRWGLKVKPHGSEWRSVMTDCFGLVPDRCHQMDTSLSSQ
ncbi:SprT-like domain-containing protein, partial [Streptococcus agalactiae]